MSGPSMSGSKDKPAIEGTERDFFQAQLGIHGQHCCRACIPA